MKWYKMTVYLKKVLNVINFGLLRGVKVWEGFIGDEGDIELLREEKEEWIIGVAEGKSKRRN